jgi:F0F1-type ATP synthase membrane subunit b/b'
MMSRNLLLRSALAVTLLFSGVSIAQKKPVQNVSPKKHPNIAAAQRLTNQAFQKITAAQEANEWDLAGHAKHAKELLDQANEELKKAAEVSNINHQ